MFNVPDHLKPYLSVDRRDFVVFAVVLGGETLFASENSSLVNEFLKWSIESIDSGFSEMLGKEEYDCVDRWRISNGV